MQCSRCGYFNADNVDTCIKCNTPLLNTNNAQQDTDGRKTQALPKQEEVDKILNKTISDKGNDIDLSKTISDSGSGDFTASKTVSDFRPEASDEQPFQHQPAAVEAFNCPSCGYPVSKEARYCPNCSSSLQAESKIASSHSNASKKN